MDSRQEYDLGELILNSLSGNASDQQIDKLREIVSNDPQAMNYYTEYISLYACLESPSSSFSVSGGDGFDKKEKPVRKFNKSALYAAISAVAALIFMVVYVNLHPVYDTPVLATIIDSINTKWADPAKPLQTGSQFVGTEGTSSLMGGYIKLDFASGAKVIIESPASFEILSDNDLQMYDGRAYATVPPNAIGFTIHTPNSKVIDLGTEFGVQVRGDKSTDVHVIKGKASILPGIGRQKNKAIDIVAGSAKRTEKGGKVSDVVLDSNAFVKDISSKMGVMSRGSEIIPVGRWALQSSVSMPFDLANNGQLIKAGNLGQKAEPVTLNGITFGVHNSSTIDGDTGMTIEDDEVEHFYSGQDNQLQNFFGSAVSLNHYQEATHFIRLTFTDLEPGQKYRFQVVAGFSWDWCAVNLYGVNNEYMHFDKKEKDGHVGIASYMWEAQSKTATLNIHSKREGSLVHIFGYTLHKIDINTSIWAETEE